MVTTSARQLINGSLKLLAVLNPTEAATPQDEADSFWALNSLIDSWGLQRLTMYAVGRTVTTALSGQASYTIGDTLPASDFPQVRPLWIEAAGYLDPNASAPVVEVPLPIITDQMNQAQQVPDLTNSLPSTLYYQPISGEVGEIILWPILTQDVDIVLYVPTAVTQFPDHATPVILPPGYERALRYNLALEIAPIFSAPPSPLVLNGAMKALADVKRANIRLVDLSVDAGLLTGTEAGWNILTGP